MTMLMLNQFEPSVANVNLDALTIVSRETFVYEDATAETSHTGNAQGLIKIKLLAESIASDFMLEKRSKATSRHGTGWQQGSVSYYYATKFGSALGSVIRANKATCEVKGVNSALAFGLMSEAIEEFEVRRLDLAVDIRFTKTSVDYASDLYLSLPEKIRLKSRLIRGRGDTIYIGSRRSTLMLRVYDKSKDYSLPLGSMWRFEIEAKGYKSNALSQALAKNPTDIQDFILSAMRATCDKFVVNFPFNNGGEVSDVVYSRVQVNTLEERFIWAKRVCVPVVRELLAHASTRDEMLRLLQLDMTILSLAIPIQQCLDKLGIKA